MPISEKSAKTINGLRNDGLRVKVRFTIASAVSANNKSEATAQTIASDFPERYFRQEADISVCY